MTVRAAPADRGGSARRGAERWPWIFAAAGGLCVAVYAVNVAIAEVRPGGPWGIGYGVAATVLLVAAALLGVRRRAMRFASRRRLGSARAWLVVHLYGGSFFLLLVLMHSGFALPNGALTQWLLGLSLWTVLSGFLGLALQTWIPRVLSSGLAVEVLYDRIPELVDEIRGQAEQLAAESVEPIPALYERSLARLLEAPRRRWIYFFDITGGIRNRLRELEYLRGLLGPEERERLDRLQLLVESKLEIDAHYTLQRALREWLYLHVPTSLLLVVLVAVHVASVLYY